ncbi:SymE family type I addiction module toxin [Chryseobacterium caseinilyticum]
MPSMNFKKLKICYLWQGKKQVPKLNISGEWLKNAGFEIGQNVQIEIKNNILIISNDNKSL